jgi:hypothetical protein
LNTESINNRATKNTFGSLALFFTIIICGALIANPFHGITSSAFSDPFVLPFTTTKAIDKSNQEQLSTASTFGKFLVAIMRSDYPRQSELVSLYKPYVTSSDYIMTHPNAKNLGYAFQLPGIKGVEYFSLSDIRANAASLKSKGVNFISYDIENNLSPDIDTANPVASVRTASSVVHSAGMKFMVAPSRSLALKYASQFASVADMFNPQGQGLQSTPDAYADYYKKITSQIRSANGNIKIIAELSTSRGNLWSMERSFSLVANLVDGVTSWYANDGLNQLNAFLTYLKQSGYI